jgi:hypothetical protein
MFMSNYHEITLTVAVSMTHAYQNDPLFSGKTISVKMDNSAFQELMSQPGCVSLRSYFAKNSNNELTLVVVGVDVNGNDMTSGLIMNRGVKCPFGCPVASPLM